MGIIALTFLFPVHAFLTVFEHKKTNHLDPAPRLFNCFANYTFLNYLVYFYTLDILPSPSNFLI